MLEENCRGESTTPLWMNGCEPEPVQRKHYCCFAPTIVLLRGPKKKVVMKRARFLFRPKK